MRGAAGTLALRVLATVLMSGATLLLARFLGAKEFGYYAWALSWVTILRVVITLGYDNLLVREAAALAPSGSWTQLRGLMRRCNQTIFGVSLVLLPVTAGLGALIAGPRSGQFAALVVGLTSLPFLSLMSMRQAMAQGLSRIIASRLPEDLVIPVAFLALVVGVELLSPEKLDATVATGLRVASILLALGLAIVLVRRYLPKAVDPAAYRYALKRLAASSIPLVMISTAHVFILEIGTIIIGAIVSSAAAGGYAVALKIATTLALIEAAANQALAPIVVNLHTRGEHRRLQSVLTKASRAMAGLSALGGALIIVLAGPILAFVGPDFAGFENVLRILVVGSLLNLISGPCQLLLIMTGHERDTAVVFVGAAILCAPLTIALTWAFGPTGTATAMAIAVFTWNAVLVWRAWTVSRLDTTAIGLIAALRQHER